MKTRGFALVLVTVLFALVPAVTQAKVTYRYVRIPAQLVTPDFIKRSGFIRDHQWDDTYALGYLREEIARRLPETAQNQIVQLDAWQWATHEMDPKTLRPVARAKKNSLPGRYEDFHTYETLTTELQTLAATYPKLATLASAGKSVQGRDLWYLRITSPGETGKPKLLYVSSMHGDEVTGKEMMVYLTRELLAKYGSDSRVTALVNNAEIYIMPSMNPDGTASHSALTPMASTSIATSRDWMSLHSPPTEELPRQWH